MDELSKLFGSAAIVKILRLFLFNPDTPFEQKTVALRTKVSPDTVRMEVSMLERIGFIKRKSFYKEVVRKRGKKTDKVKKRTSGWMLNSNFTYLEPLQKFLTETMTLDSKNLIKRLRKAGKLKLVIVSGVFLHQWESRTDLFLVGDGIKGNKLETAMKDIEAEIGRELKYTHFTTKDFTYRLNLRDRLVYDILEFPHKKLVDRIGLS